MSFFILTFKAAQTTVSTVTVSNTELSEQVAQLKVEQGNSHANTIALQEALKLIEEVLFTATHTCKISLMHGYDLMLAVFLGLTG